MGSGFEFATVGGFPGIIPCIALVATFYATPEEAELEHQVQLEVFDPHGARLPVEAQMRITPHRIARLPHRESSFRCIFNAAGLPVSEGGDYQFRLSVDGQQFGHTTLTVLGP
jgi:hypothetical protein